MNNLLIKVLVAALFVTYITSFNYGGCGGAGGGGSSGTPASPYTAPTAVDGYVWVANNISNDVSRILKSDTAVSTTITAGTFTWGIAVDENYVWVTNFGSNDVTRILKSDSTTATTPVGISPYSVGDMTGWAYDNIPP